MTTLYNAQRCIEQAMLDAGILQRGDTPSTADYTTYMDRLNDLCIFLQTQGLKLWLNTLRTITLVAGTASYTFGPSGTGVRALRVISADYVPVSGGSWPLNPMAWEDWQTLSDKSQQGAVNSYFVDKQQLNLVFWPWQVPDATAAQGTIEALCQNPCSQVTAITDVMNFPHEWYLALRWGLADDIASGQPQAVMDRCQAKATMYRQALEDWDVEDASTSFSPSGQMGMSQTNFR